MCQALQKVRNQIKTTNYLEPEEFNLRLKN